MADFDLNEARHFLELLVDDINQPQLWQAFHETDKTIDGQKFYNTLDASADYFKSCAGQGFGVFLTINKTDGKGRSLENIMGYRACFIDIDDGDLPKLALTPTIVNQRDNLHSHVYWRVDGIVTADQYSRAQRHLALYYNSDKSVTDGSRVLRLAGSVHVKNPSNPSVYRVTQSNRVTHHVTDLLAAHPLTGEQQAELDKWCDNRDSIDDGTGYEDSAVYRERMIKWLTGGAEMAVKGEGRSAMIIKVSSMGHDLGLPLLTTQQLMWEYYNQAKIVPPYTPEERGTKLNIYVKRAYKYSNNSAGCRTAGGVFMAAGSVPAPTGGWEANAAIAPVVKATTETLTYDAEQVVEVDNRGKISAQAGASLFSQVTNKSPANTLAKAYIGTQYPDGGLICASKLYYWYDGQQWNEVTKEELETDVTYAFDQNNWNFEPSKITTIAKMVTLLVTRAAVENNTWMNGRKDSVLVMENGMLLIKPDGVELMKNDSNYFTLNALDYNYEANAACPHWLNFLNSSLENSASAIMQLQDWFGYQLLEGNKFQRFLLLQGQSRSGKGVITNVMQDLFGRHNVAAPTLEGLTTDCGRDTLSQKKIAILSEANYVHPSQIGKVVDTLKLMTADDALEFKRMYVGGITHHKWAKMTMTSNKIPAFIDESGALSARLMLMIFRKSFRGQEDHGLSDRLKTERTGILNWAIEGAMRVLKNNKLHECPEFTEAREDLERDMFPLAEFTEKFCKLGDGYKTTVDDLYNAYQYYCKNNHIKKPYSKTKFKSVLTSSTLNIHSRRLVINGQREYCLTNIAINPDAIKPVFPSVSEVVDNATV